MLTRRGGTGNVNGMQILLNTFLEPAMFCHLAVLI